MLEQILTQLGLDTEETALYVALLETGTSSAGELAKSTGLVRSSLYGILARLQEQEFIHQSLKQGVKVFTAESPDKIHLLFEQRIENLQQSQKAYEALLPTLHTIQPSKLLHPSLQLFEGAESLKHLLKDMLLYKNIETQAYWPIKKMVEVLSPDFFRYHNKERIKNNLYTHAIWPQHQTVDITQHPYLGSGEVFKREIRIAPDSIDFTMGYWIYGKKVAFVSSLRESIGFIIESTELAEMLRSQFEVMWNLSKPIKTTLKF